jgi:uroporphyrinogen decarboxylase
VKVAQNLNKKERVIAAINHYETDIVPYHLRFTGAEREKLIAYTGIEDFEKHYGNHIEVKRCMDFTTEVEKGMFRDEFGVVWDRRDGSDIGIPSGYVLKEPDLAGFKLPVPLEDEIDKQMTDLVSSKWDTFRAVNVGFTLYERAWSMRGIENLLMDMLLEEDFVEALFDQILEYNINAMGYARKVSDDFDAFYFGDDWGQQTGLIMSRTLWKKLIGPRITKLIEYGKECGKYTILHSCGNIIELLPDLIDAGLDVYDTFQPEVYDIKQVKKKFGDKLTFLGGISTQTLLPYGSPQTIRSTSNEIIEIMSKDGGFIAAPTHDVPADVPADNILAMIDVFTQQRRGGRSLCRG